MGWQNKICSGDPANIRKSRTFMARMRLYVKLREMPPHDYQSTLSDYTVVQFDGAGGVNEDPSAKNLKYHIYGLENIRVLDCGVDFAITPDNQVIDFGKFNVLDIRRHNMTKNVLHQKRPKPKMVNAPMASKSVLRFIPKKHWWKAIRRCSWGMDCGYVCWMKILHPIHSINILNTPTLPATCWSMKKPIRQNCHL